MRVLATIAALVLAVGVGAAHPSPATAWEVSKATNGLIVNRSVDDTATGTITITRYWGYKSGNTWAPAHNPAFSSSYTNSDVLNIDGNYLDGFELDVKEGYRCQLIAMSQAGAPAQVRFAILNDPAKVTVENTPTVNVTGSTTVTGTVSLNRDTTQTVAVTGTVPVSLESSNTTISFPATMTADIGSVWGVDREQGLFFLIVAAVLLGRAVWEWLIHLLGGGDHDR